MNELKKKPFYEEGMSPEEQVKRISRAMAEEQAAQDALPAIFKPGDMLEEVINDDDTMGNDEE